MLAGQLAHITAALFTGSAVYIFYGLCCHSQLREWAARTSRPAAVTPR
jgi:hypothetical protein